MRIRFTDHAIDRASQRLLEAWLSECPDRKPGLLSWLEGTVARAFQTAAPGAECGKQVKVATSQGCFVGTATHGYSGGRYFLVTTFAPNLTGKARNVGTRTVRPCPVCQETECECAEAMSRQIA